MTPQTAVPIWVGERCEVVNPEKSAIAPPRKCSTAYAPDG